MTPAALRNLTTPDGTLNLTFLRVINQENPIMLALGTFLAVIGVAQSAGGILLDASIPRVAPWFCHDLECPRYNVKSSNDKFEIRNYEPSVWVATNLTAMTYTRAENTMMFFKLFGYIAGNNSLHMKIAMTAPVLTEVYHGQGPDCESNFTMRFMVPFALQANPPAPLDPTVFIDRQPAITVAVRQYGGFSTDELKMENLVELTEALDNATIPYVGNMFLTAGYDGPYSFKNRHNEIWVVPM
ncbi:heme-binding protein 2-like isoform X2 [Dreissena polymorpha]|uniref:heme-binding protein 2-like isoform X2 n=1 Tax=Dreissena polymorpha TaxID=45954 RepID=UPI002263D014|nr:heme-binding protein 2-like isoform X2 [Dreissena polymorpha]